MRKLSLFLPLFSLFLFNGLYSQAPEKWNSAKIYHEIQKLNFLGSVLYLAAHPDDENTRLITYLANHGKANTAYLSLTRGDGGQNLISPEMRIVRFNKNPGIIGRQTNIWRKTVFFQSK